MSSRDFRSNSMAAMSTSAELHLGVTYGTHKISNLEDLRKNERNQSEDTVTATIAPSCEVARTRVFSNLRVTNISLSF